MKTFAFRLEPLLRYREHQEAQALQDWSLTRQKLQTCEEKIAEYQTVKRGKEAELDELSAAGMDMESYRIYVDYLAGMEIEIEAEKQRLQQLQKTVAEKQAELARRAVDKKMLENFKDRQKEQYISEMQALEHKDADDMILLRKARE
jgi:flagellar FliJ protein